MVPLRHCTVVVPVDFSDDTELAIRSGLERVESPEGLHVVHVLYPLDYVSPGVLRGGITNETREAAVRKNLAEILTRLGAEATKVTVLVGDPGLKVTDYAETVNAGLIIVPSHGFQQMSHFLLGSTAERIIRHAPCSVLVIRSERTRKNRTK